MYLIITNSAISGIISFLIGTIVFNMLTKKNDIKDIRPFGKGISFFISGIILYLLLGYLRKL